MKRANSLEGTNYQRFPQEADKKSPMPTAQNEFKTETPPTKEAPDSNGFAENPNTEWFEEEIIHHPTQK